MVYVLIKRVGNDGLPGELFSKLEIDAGDIVTEVAERASNKFGWNEQASQVSLFRAESVGEDEPTAEAERAARGKRLQTGWSLGTAGITEGSYLLAVLASQPTQGK